MSAADRSPAAGSLLGVATASALRTHLSQMQNLAMKAETMLCCLLAIVDDPEQGDLSLNLVESALDQVRKLNVGLDSVEIGRLEV